MTPAHATLSRFLDAQADSYATALSELRAGRKRSHWMWFVLPQIAGLGRTETARFYAIADLDEARAYLAHPVLGARLRECVDATLAHRKRTPEYIFGEVDAMKFRSCLTLFECAAAGTPEAARFAEALSAFYGGRRDEATLDRLPR